jgi:hypothetical protein
MFILRMSAEGAWQGYIRWPSVFTYKGILKKKKRDLLSDVLI